MAKRKSFLYGASICGIMMALIPVQPSHASYHFDNFEGRPPIHQLGGAAKAPQGLSPAQIKRAYNLPASGGKGVIAIIDAYDAPTVENDLNVFSKQFNLPACTTANGCFKKYKMDSAIKTDYGWAEETALDVEWAHAIAPNAKILLVEAKTAAGKNLTNAIDYARAQKDVVAVSMSWGGDEFPEEVAQDAHFNSPNHQITFFASSGDDGTGPSWPAASPQVVAVGGTHLNFTKDGQLKSETAWTGSGGGSSVYEAEPAYQKSYSIAKAHYHRAIPDVAYDADPNSGFSVYETNSRGQGGWYVIGGTSAGAPQWAAIKALGLKADNDKFYADKAAANNTSYFRDIKSGNNGDCGYYCQTRQHYDYVTGLGSPLTVNF